MPITEAEMSYEDMKKTADTHRCTCGGRLNIAWGGAFGYNCYILRCAENVDHNTVTRHSKKQDEYNSLRREVFNLDTVSLQKMSETQMIERINTAKFPQELTEPDKVLLAKAAISYGFDPIMMEITIYQGRPYVSIDGRYRKAQETGMLDGVETRPATKQEREDWSIPIDDYFFRSEVYVKDASRPFVGWGRVRGSETKPGSSRQGDNTSMFKPIQSNPQRMAEKRAEAQALRKAFHIPLPSIEEIGAPGEHYEEPHYDVESTARVIDEVTEPEPKPEPEKKPKAKKETKNESPEQSIPERDPDSITDLNSLYKACNEDFGLQPKQVNAELGVNSKTEISETPSECYRQIAAVRLSEPVEA